jgi:hypothetical protein
MEMLMQVKNKKKKDLKISQSMDVGDSDAIKRIRQTRKIREKGESTTNPHEKDTFLKRGGPIMPNFKKVQRKTKKRYG